MDRSEWVRIAIAMALMLFGFILLPGFFLVRDKRQEEREAAAALENRSTELSDNTHDEAGVSR
jgi:hypothetical protein